MTHSLSVYIHWPFCKKKCPYCDFNSHVRNEIDEDKWLASYLREISFFEEFIAGKQIKSVFFGGGTPSLMNPRIVGGIIDKLNAISSFDAIEITLEANPTSVESQKFQDFKSAGVNRISMGIQSLNERDLKFLGREHSPREAIAAIKIAANTFDNYSIDLIYARPNQTLNNWRAELKEALRYAKNHISLYQLTIEKGTEFYAKHKKGAFLMPEQEEALAIYEATSEALAEHALERYEISNYAVPGYESVHNLSYWHYDQYLGIGPGAHSRVKLGDDAALHAIMMTHSPEKWIDSVAKGQNGIQQKQALSLQDIASECILMGLRLENGIDFKSFKAKFSCNLIDFLNRERLDFFAKSNLLVYDSSHIKLTNKGKMLMNYICSQLL